MLVSTSDSHLAMRCIAEEATATEVTQTLCLGKQQQQVHVVHIMILIQPVPTLLDGLLAILPLIQFSLIDCCSYHYAVLTLHRHLHSKPSASVHPVFDRIDCYCSLCAFQSCAV